MGKEKGFWSLLKKLPCILGIRCPKCGSWSVEEVVDINSITNFPKPKKLNVTMKTTRCRCKKCGYEWDCIKISSI